MPTVSLLLRIKPSREGFTIKGLPNKIRRETHLRGANHAQKYIKHEKERQNVLPKDPNSSLITLKYKIDEIKDKKLVTIVVKTV